MVWGCISGAGYGELHLVDGIMNKEQYVKIMEESLLGTFKTLGLKKSDTIFQQDNDPKHTSKLSSEWFAHRHIKVLPWLSNSPDMNPMEHVWAYLQTHVQQRHALPTSKASLWNAICEEWAKMDDGFLAQLYAGMPARVAALGAAKGWYTSY